MAESLKPWMPAFAGIHGGDEAVNYVSSLVGLKVRATLSMQQAKHGLSGAKSIKSVRSKMLWFRFTQPTRYALSHTNIGISRVVRAR
jgi:hypothetical protein